MKYYPIPIDFTNKKVLVLGGDQVTNHKIESLLKGEFEICVLARDSSQDLVGLIKLYPHRLHLKGQYLKEDFIFMGCGLLIITTSDPDLNQAMESYAKTERIFYTRCDRRGDSSSIMEKIVQRDPIHGTILPDDLSPTLTKLVDQEVQGSLEGYDLEGLDLLTQVRGQLKDLDPQDRNQVIKGLYQKDKDTVKRYLEGKNEDQVRDPEEQPSNDSDPASGQDA